MSKCHATMASKRSLVPALSGKQAKALRRKAKMTVQRVADLLGVNVTTVYRWERGAIPIPGPARQTLLALLR